MFDDTDVDIDVDDATLARIDAVMHKHVKAIVRDGELLPELLPLALHRAIIGIIVSSTPRHKWDQLADLYGAAFVQQLKGAGELADAEDETLQ